MSLLNKNKSVLFLMELTVCIIFFSFAAIICLRIFINSLDISERSNSLTNGVIEVENAVQLIKSDRGKLNLLCEYYGAEINEEGNKVDIWLNENYETCSENDKVYKLSVKNEKREDIINSFIIFQDKEGNLIYSIDIKTFSGEVKSWIID